MNDGRYIVYGVVPSEHEAGNPELSPENQRIQATLPIYATDDSQEAEKIVNTGGFMRGDIWCAVTGAKDTQTGRVIGTIG